MKRKAQLLVLSVLMFGVQSVASASTESPYPADAEASYDLPALETHADRQARMGDSPGSWGVGKREVQPHDPFPFGGGLIDD